MSASPSSGLPTAKKKKIAQSTNPKKESQRLKLPSSGMKNVQSSQQNNLLALIDPTQQQKVICVQNPLYMAQSACQVPNQIYNQIQNNNEMTQEQFDERTIHLFNQKFSTQNCNVLSNNRWFKWWEKLRNKQHQLYNLPSGPIGRQFVGELADEINSFCLNNDISQRILVFTNVVLQRQKSVKKAKDIRRLISSWLQSWKDGNYNFLVKQSLQCIQQRNNSLKSRKRKQITLDDGDVSLVRRFARLMNRGKIRSAVRLITNRDQNGVLSTNDDVLDSKGNQTGVKVLDVLKQKHPESKLPWFDSLVQCGELEAFADIEITGQVVETVVRKLNGSCGPSGSNSDHWADMCLRFGAQSKRLREAIALLSRQLCNSIVKWENISALFSNRLIGLDKNPGVRPIGIGESLRRIIAKSVTQVLRSDVEDVCGTSQLSCGIRNGIEASIHAVNSQFDQAGPGVGALLVDANNGFNALIRKAAVINSRFLWPQASRFIFNTHQGAAPLILQDESECLYSEEGVTQGDPLSMLFYGMALLPLIQKLEEIDDVIQTWYADDSCAVASLKKLRKWYDELSRLGPMFGYSPNPEKTHLVVRECDLDEARKIFDGTGIQIGLGHRYLGEFVGSPHSKNEYVQNKIQEWVLNVQKLSQAAPDEPQSTLLAFTKSLQQEWAFLQRVIDIDPDTYIPLKNEIFDNLVPAIIGGKISKLEMILFTLPPKKGGLGINDPTQKHVNHFEISQMSSKHVSDCIRFGFPYQIGTHLAQISDAQKKVKQLKDDFVTVATKEVLPQLLPNRRRAVQRTIDNKVSTWLSAIPLRNDGFDMSAQCFRDTICLRYGRTPDSLPSYCDGCGSSFNLQHGLDCQKGGLIIKRHNEVRNLFADLSSLAWGNAQIEPKINDDKPYEPQLIADLNVRGVWEAQTQALFDIRVVDTDAMSYASRTVASVLASAETEKMIKYRQVCLERRASFTPLVVSIDGVFGELTNRFVSQIAQKLSEKWERSYSVIIGWIRARVQFAIFKATNLCVRGSRRKWKGLGLEDGAAVPYFE